MVSRPILPLKKGYVEVEIDGTRTYKNVSTGQLISDERETISAEDITLDLMAEHEERLCMLEITTGI